jgi:hypothetical protein
VAWERDAQQLHPQRRVFNVQRSTFNFDLSLVPVSGLSNTYSNAKQVRPAVLMIAGAHLGLTHAALPASK